MMATGSMNDDTYLRMFRWLLLVGGTASLLHSFITGRLYIRNRKWITTRFHIKGGKLIVIPGTDDPVTRSQTPRDFWFLWGMAVFIFAVLVFGFFTVL